MRLKLKSFINQFKIIKEQVLVNSNHNENVCNQSVKFPNINDQNFVAT